MASLQFVDADHQAKFAQDGYVVVRLLSVADAATARALAPGAASGAVDRLARDDAYQIYNSIFDDVSPGLAESETSISNMTLPVVESVVAASSVLETGFVIKPTGFAATPLHLHAPATAEPFAACVVAWCALNDVGPDNGCLRIVPGSQWLFRYVAARGADTSWLDRMADEILADFAVDVPLQAGEAVFFDNMVWHASHPNRSGAPRVAFGQLLAVTGSQYCDYRHDDAETVSAIPIARRRDAHAAAAGGTQPDISAFPAISTFPVWQPKPSLAQVRELLTRRGPRARADYDPLDTVAHLADPPCHFVAPEHGGGGNVAAPGGRAKLRLVAQAVPGLMIMYRLALRVVKGLV